MSAEDTGEAVETEADPFEAIRQHEDLVEEVGKERRDDFGAAARVCLAVARGERPEPEDCEQLNLPTGFDNSSFGDALTAPPTSARPTRSQVRPLAARVLKRVERDTE